MSPAVSPVWRGDVIVIGGGLAAACAAIEAAGLGARVALVDKGRLGMSGSTPMSGGGISHVSGETGDSHLFFREDTYLGGERMADPALVDIMVEEAGPGIRRLRDLGVPFELDAGGTPALRQGLGHRFRRSIAPAGDGWGLMQVLRKEILHRGVQVFERAAAVSVLKAGGMNGIQDSAVNATGNVTANTAADGEGNGAGEVRGLLALQIDTGELAALYAPAVIIAAGSATGLYPVASSSYLTTGDSFGLAFRAGAVLANMEFVEFTFIPAPGGIPIPSQGATPFPAAGALLYNAKGERFLERYDPARMERTTRATVVRGIWLETEAGRGPAMMDATVIGEAWKTWLEASDAYRKIRAAGVDPWRERFPWTIAVHTLLGGICIDPLGATLVPGLFAAGEAATGIQGANRLSGNALADCMVFGFRAGRTAARRALERRREGFGPRGLCGFSTVDFSISNPVSKEDDPAEQEEVRKIGKIAGPGPGIHRTLQEFEAKLLETTWKGIGVCRDGDQLKETRRELHGLWAEAAAARGARGPAQVLRWLELQNMALTAVMVAEAALMRAETRGQHWRRDCPDPDPSWERWISFQKRGEAIECGVLPAGRFSAGTGEIRHTFRLGE
ncbi:MAG: FAD-binding protein [Firmicutes bacterium]|nr:FAD-binding protein [Bacillota bacterium]